jgi:hypothetical protein
MRWASRETIVDRREESTCLRCLAQAWRWIKESWEGKSRSRVSSASGPKSCQRFTAFPHTLLGDRCIVRRRAITAPPAPRLALSETLIDQLSVPTYFRMVRGSRASTESVVTQCFSRLVSYFYLKDKMHIPLPSCPRSFCSMPTRSSFGRPVSFCLENLLWQDYPICSAHRPQDWSFLSESWTSVSPSPSLSGTASAIATLTLTLML